MEITVKTLKASKAILEQLPHVGSDFELDFDTKASKFNKYEYIGFVNVKLKNAFFSKTLIFKKDGYYYRANDIGNGCITTHHNGFRALNTRPQFYWASNCDVLTLNAIRYWFMLNTGVENQIFI